MNLTPDMLLSTGRVAKHTPNLNGSQLATPTPGPVEMTEAEWVEYCDVLRLVNACQATTPTIPPRALARLKTAAALRVQDLAGGAL